MREFIPDGSEHYIFYLYTLKSETERERENMKTSTKDDDERGLSAQKKHFNITYDHTKDNDKR